MRERRCDFANAFKFEREFVGNHHPIDVSRIVPISQQRRGLLQEPVFTEAWRASCDDRGAADGTPAQLSVIKWLGSR